LHCLKNPAIYSIGGQKFATLIYHFLGHIQFGKFSKYRKHNIKVEVNKFQMRIKFLIAVILHLLHYFSLNVLPVNGNISVNKTTIPLAGNELDHHRILRTSADFFNSNSAHIVSAKTVVNNGVSTTKSRKLSPFPIDLDLDGDIDLISVSRSDNTVSWHENLGSPSQGLSSGGFITHDITTTAAVGAIGVYAIDLDSDGDIDIITTNYEGDCITWYENNGLQTFTTHILSSLDGTSFTITGAIAPYAYDLDNDGDIDIIAASQGSKKIYWFENNGNELFTIHDITGTYSINCVYSTYAVDIDGDSFVDILSASDCDNRIAWYKNDGSNPPIFTLQNGGRIGNAFGARSVYAVDMDNDGDIGKYIISICLCVYFSFCLGVIPYSSLFILIHPYSSLLFILYKSLTTLIYFILFYFIFFYFIFSRCIICITGRQYCSLVGKY
jgi:hypothetical protein